MAGSGASEKAAARERTEFWCVLAASAGIGVKALLRGDTLPAIAGLFGAILWVITRNAWSHWRGPRKALFFLILGYLAYYFLFEYKSSLRGLFG